ncbi:MAG: hypothetical protein ACD_49C00023G0008 [uncultured bacterium (gcode 4)]|uniref:Uncharacterized protein n=1 Tax=uncultured bacterium (gcode 4) TaxID=1234023 RepID=K2AFD4_9BACT|nr:MAG: hypothetical protein ACD_49C00023G0008 [uncultured bacterium (gcode 4)]
MFIWTIFKKYKEKEYRLILIKDLILSLNIDSRQKNLYIESLNILDDESLDRFYKKLVWVIDIIEENENNLSFSKELETTNFIKQQEQKQKKEEINSYNFLLDNI